MQGHPIDLQTQPTQALLRDALAGAIATLPMTLFMLTTQRFLPRGQRYELPPELLTKDLARRAHVRYRMSKRQILGATLVAHFAYGSAMGLLYRPLEKKKILPAPLQGGLFGLLIWTASYFGLLPLLNLSASGDKEPVQRNLLMLAAHAVWGMSLGEAADVLSTR